MQVKAWLLVIISMGLERSTAEAQNKAIATLPFAAISHPAIYLSGQLGNGETGWWDLDTGASECLLDRTAARRAGLVFRGHRELHGAGTGTVRLDSIRGRVPLRISGKAVPTCDHFGAIELRSANLDRTHPLTGVLGYEFFARYVVRVDFGNHTVTLYDPRQYRYTGSGDTVKLDLTKRQPRVQVRIRTASRPEVVRSLIVDTGSEDFVDDSTVRRNAKARGVTVATTGLGESYEAVIGTLDKVRIGRSTFTNIPGVASRIGIVGNGIWSKFVCIFDYAHERLILEERP